MLHRRRARVSAPRKPEIARSVVVLPAPLVPSRVTIDRSARGATRPDRGRHVVIGDLDVRELEERGLCRAERPGRRPEGDQLRTRRQILTSPSLEDENAPSKTEGADLAGR
jgi:hypothetical protein